MRHIDGQQEQDQRQGIDQGGEGVRHSPPLDAGAAENVVILVHHDGGHQYARRQQVPAVALKPGRDCLGVHADHQSQAEEQ